MSKQTLMKALLMIEEFRKLDPEMQLQTAATFICVAIRPGITMKELGEKLGISQASCSRNVAALSKWHRLNKEGHNLVVATEDPVERRRKVVHLTPEGERVATSVRSILGEEDAF